MLAFEVVSAKWIKSAEWYQFNFAVAGLLSHVNFGPQSQLESIERVDTIRRSASDGTVSDVTVKAGTVSNGTESDGTVTDSNVTDPE